MHAISAILLGLGLMMPGGDPARPSDADPARLQETLHDHRDPAGQSQAALLLVQCTSDDAENAVRQALEQTEEVDVFTALAGAVRLCQDGRFADQLLSALRSVRPAVRQAAAEALAVLPHADLTQRLKEVADDPKLELPVRQAALWVLGRSGRKDAVPVLLDHLEGDNEALQSSAADALAETAGQSYGVDAVRWREWWDRHKDLSSEQWLEMRLACQTSRVRRLEGDLDRARMQVLRLQQQVYSRLPVADRPAYIQMALEQDDPMVHALAGHWALELLPNVEPAQQQILVQVLFRLSHDGSVEVQRAAVLGLGRVHDPAVMDRLRTLVQEGRPAVRAAAARALAQQAREEGPDAKVRRDEVIAVLQKAVDDSALEVVVEAADGLESLGALDATPVLAGLLHHHSEAVRETAAQALERSADAAVLKDILAALDDASPTVRFSLIGALAHVGRDGGGLAEEKQKQILDKVEAVLQHDADAGVRSRAATALGECGGSAQLTALWRSLTAGEDGRVQEKAWLAFVEIAARSNSLALVQDWDKTMAAAKQGLRRVQLLGEILTRWQKKAEMKTAVAPVEEMLVQAELDLGKWSAAFPLVRDLLSRPGGETETNQRLHWLLTIGQQAMQEGNKTEALRAVQEAQPYLPRGGPLAEEFDKLQKQATP
ncbi:MAG TPA: HEAT repeat domain-containing protein [Gemmataceae bacterium]|nr:HEAT repeat domain-containing protein [Gemmataceae bacterium]